MNYHFNQYTNVDYSSYTFSFVVHRSDKLVNPQYFYYQEPQKIHLQLAPISVPKVTKRRKRHQVYTLFIYSCKKGNLDMSSRKSLLSVLSQK